MIALNQGDPIAPKYEQVRRVLLEQIRAKRLGLGEKIPSEAELMRQFGVSRVTIRRAVRELVQDGILESVAGVGTVVRGRVARPTIAILYGHQFCGPQDVPSYRLILDAFHRILTDRQFKPRPYFVRSYGVGQPPDRDQLIADIRRGVLKGLLAVAWPCPDFEDTTLADQDRELSNLIEESGIPCSGWSGGEMRGAVALDYDSVGYLGTSHFLDEGLRRVALIAGSDRIADQAPVMDGYSRALGERGLEVNSDWIIKTTRLSRPAGYEAMRRLWSLDDRPEAVVIADDFLARGVMSAVLESGINVPESLQLAALTVKDSDMFFPRPFVKLQIDVEALAQQIIDRLQEIIGHPGRMLDTVLQTPRIVLDSRQFEVMEELLV